MTTEHISALMDITPRPEAVFTDGSGAWLKDSTGNRYLDFVQGWAVNTLGHASPVIVEALQNQAQRLINCSPAYFNAPMIKLAALLRDLSGLDQCFFANSGAEANEGAIKLARKWGQQHKGGAYEIITTVGGFHGRTLATMSASGKPQWDALFEPKVPGFTKVPLNDLSALQTTISDKTVAIMLEPIQGEAGVIPATDAYLKAVWQLCREQNILLIFDEIQTGIGRTGTLFAFEQLGFTPDIVTLGKGIGGGVPLSALLASNPASCFSHGDQGGTFNGNPLMTAVGHAVVSKVAQPLFLAHVNAMSDYLTKKLTWLSDSYKLGGVRGRGLLLALELSRGNGPEIVKNAHANGLLINSPRPTSLRFMPALNVTVAEMDAMIDILDKVLAETYAPAMA